jgi:[citrate (pro-3S)-lyase] ligase
MVLMENSATRLKRYADSLSTFRHEGKRIGCIIMNANPFTEGHRYLIQQAVAQCDWLHVFLVKEDTSRFPYEDRFDLVLKGTQGIARLTVHRGSEYIISRATFPCYFIKEQSVINHCYTEIDLKIFRQYLAPALGITHRFVGTEPFCTVTSQYNHDMHFWLETPDLPAPPVKLVEIERLCFENVPISASWVRKLLVKKELAAITPLVPISTLNYLTNMLQKAAASKAPASAPLSVLATGEK